MQKSQTCQTNGATTIVLANIKKYPSSTMMVEFLGEPRPCLSDGLICEVLPRLGHTWVMPMAHDTWYHQGHMEATVETCSLVFIPTQQ